MNATIENDDTAGTPLPLEWVPCCLCGVDDCDPVAVGEDFEYHTTDETFRAVRCRRCDLVYLNPRPTVAALDLIYPETYHAYDFSEEKFGLVHQVRRRLEARRLLRWTRGLPDDARILDVGCGDGFHLGLLRDFGPSGWRIEGVDPSRRAAAAARGAGFEVHEGTVEDLELPRDAYDFVLHIMTIEHVPEPVEVLGAIRELLRPGGRVAIVTDNVDSPDFEIFGGRHWGGYHFPRHLHLFTPDTLGRLADRAGLAVDRIDTAVSPVNWVYSLRNLLVDLEAPEWLYERFSLDSPGTLAVFTAFDMLNNLADRGAILHAILRRDA